VSTLTTWPTHVIAWRDTRGRRNDSSSRQRRQKQDLTAIRDIEASAFPFVNAFQKAVPASLLVVVVRPLDHPSTRANNALQHARRVRIATSALERLASIHEFHPNLCNAPDDGRW